MDNKKYCEKFRLRISDFDCYRNIKPSSVLDVFQEAASTHSKIIGAGFDDMKNKNLMWVLVKVKFKIYKNPDINSSVVVKTWPLKPQRFFMGREYVIKDENGEIFIKGSSQWFTVDIEKRKISVPENLYNIDEYCSDNVFDEKMGSVPDFNIQNAQEYIIKPCYNDMDINMHLNNIRYADFVINSLNPKKDETVDEFQIDFHKEITNTDDFRLFKISEESNLIFKGVNDKGDKLFCCRVRLKDKNA